MPLEVVVDGELTGEIVLEVYRAFCEAYGIREVDESDEAYFLHQAMAEFQIGYQPFMGAMFFVQPYKKGFGFEGYNTSFDHEWEARDKRFQELAKKRLEQEDRVHIV